ncbi:hypothetical protein [Crocosphaera chwakensis]|uniref:DUF3592 domain-containing protein n=1 Tax=Crocosphaera chwakensis CCY0110 TaxID=391612 RepID=A3IRG7_9CHRO|nr:hypothetical protein [Crocosphaera chwakensis]EAZ90969.1 hypothetical protein CY0110_21315 [Crocosphaera chwakensis CCY0110]
MMNWLLTLLCLIFLVTSVCFGVYNYQFLQKSIPIEGKVIGVDKSITRNHDGGFSKNSYPIIEYIPPHTKEKQTFKASVAALNVKTRSKVWVAYHQKKQTAKIISFGEIFLLFTLFSLFGLTLLLILVPLSKSSQMLYTLLKLLHIF